MTRILLFGELKEIAGTGFLETDAKDIETLKTELISHWPSFANKTLNIAINKKVIHENKPITAKDEVAVMPPFSGG